MNEVYSVRRTIIDGKSTFLANQNSSSNNLGNYLMYETPWLGDENEIRIYDIEGSGRGVGSVLVMCLALEAIKLGCESVTGEFVPRGIREKILSWYERRGFELVDGSELRGSPYNILVATKKRLKKYNVQFTQP